MHVGERKTDKVAIQIFRYDESELIEKEVATLEELPPLKDGAVTWINVDGLHKTEIIEKLGKMFHLHSLLLEDVLNTQQRPKVDEYDNHIYVVLRMLRHDESENVVRDEQISLVIGTGYVLSFQEGPGDVFDSVRDRIRFAKGRIRKLEADYLGYALMDTVVDNYFVVLEKFGDEIEALEQGLIRDPQQEHLHKLYHLKREMIFLSKVVWPLREVMNAFLRQEFALISKNVLLFFHDLYDHTVQIRDTIESCRDTLSGLLDIYMSGVSNKMNAIMKVLTIISTIFMPLTLITGLYGMNFDHMPELHWRFGYPFSIALMLMTTIGMLSYIKRENWLS
jgi:magnesium transporter